jgi:hypothetical protein
MMNENHRGLLLPVAAAALRLSLAAVAMAGPGLAAVTAPADPNPVPEANPTEAIVGNVRTGRILFLGNSITLHGPRPEVGWTNNWGMAASARDKDYVHVLARSIAAITGMPPVLMIENIAEFEQHGDTYDLGTRLKKAIAFKPDTVIVAIGENVPALASEESRTAFRASMTRLLNVLKDAGDPAIIVRSSFWPDPTKDEILRQTCAEAGGVFVDISALGKDESHYARSERPYAHSGVGAHPGDKGMQAIADALLAAIKTRPTRTLAR